MEPYRYDPVAVQDAQRLHTERVGRKYIIGSIIFGISFMAMCTAIMLMI
jgi:hypothetical protein